MYLSIRFSKVLDHILLELIVVPVTDADKVVSLFGEPLTQVYPVVYTSTKDNSLAWLAKDLMGFLDPLRDNVA